MKKKSPIVRLLTLVLTTGALSVLWVGISQADNMERRMRDLKAIMDSKFADQEKNGYETKPKIQKKSYDYSYESKKEVEVEEVKDVMDEVKDTISDEMDSIKEEAPSYDKEAEAESEGHGIHTASSTNEYSYKPYKKDYFSEETKKNIEEGERLIEQLEKTDSYDISEDAAEVYEEAVEAQAEVIAEETLETEMINKYQETEELMGGYTPESDDSDAQNHGYITNSDDYVGGMEEIEDEVLDQIDIGGDMDIDEYISEIEDEVSQKVDNAEDVIKDVTDIKGSSKGSSY